MPKLSPKEFAKPAVLEVASCYFRASKKPLQITKKILGFAVVLLSQLFLAEVPGKAVRLEKTTVKFEKTRDILLLFFGFLNQALDCDDQSTATGLNGSLDSIG